MNQKKIFSWFVKGLFAILPIAITVYLVYWLGSLAESFIGGIIRFIVGQEHYISGTGLIAGFIIITAVGYFIQIWLFRNLFYLVDKFLKAIPGVNTLYISILGMIEFFDSSKKKNFDRVVMVKFQGMNMLGLAIRDNLENIIPNGLGNGKVLVFIPVSLQMAGVLVIVPKEELVPVDMPVEAVMRLNFTAGTAV